MTANHVASHRDQATIYAYPTRGMCRTSVYRVFRLINRAPIYQWPYELFDNTAIGSGVKNTFRTCVFSTENFFIILLCHMLGVIS
jgi:hypothetical protein